MVSIMHECQYSTEIQWITIFNRYPQKTYAQGMWIVPGEVTQNLSVTKNKSVSQCWEIFYHVLCILLDKEDDENFELLFNELKYRTRTENNKSTHFSLSTSNKSTVSRNISGLDVIEKSWYQHQNLCQSIPSHTKVFVYERQNQ